MYLHWDFLKQTDSLHFKILDPYALVEMPLTINLYSVPLSLGSSASRKPSPKRLNDRTVRVIATPGKVTSHQDGYNDVVASDSILPHDGVGAEIPAPR